VILGITGSILVYHDDFPVWFGSDQARYELAKGEPAPVAELIKAAALAAGENTKATAITWPAAPGDPVTIRFARATPGGGRPTGSRRNAWRWPGQDRSGFARDP